MATPLPVEAPADPFDFSAARIPVAAGAHSATAPKPTNRSQSSGSGLLIAVLVGILGLGGVGGWLYVKNLPVYSGVVSGTRIPATSHSIPVSVPWSAMGVEASSQPPVIDYFKRHKSSILSNMVTIEISASAQGLEIRLSPSEIAALVSVEPLQIPDLKQFIAAHEAGWDATRKIELAQYGKDLCENVAKAKLKGDRMSDISDYRDVVALNALVRGLGRHCQAVTNNTVYPCVFEDKDGKLYFVVPIQATELMVQEKAIEGRSRVLPAQFRIQATIPPPVAVTPPLAAAPPSPAQPVKPAMPDRTERPKAEGETDAKPQEMMKSM